MYSTPGSHAFYDDFNSASTDAVHPAVNSFGNPCSPFALLEYAYYPGSVASHAPDNSLQEPEFCTKTPKGIYQLIDIFDSSIGLWEQRDNPLLFSQEGNTNNQRFACTDGDCEHTAGSPWSGGYGLNPVNFVENTFGVFTCDCPDESFPDCTVIDFEDCLYDFNPYLCDDYDIVMPESFSYEGNTVTNPYDDDGDLVVNLNFSSLGVHANPSSPINWTFPPSLDVECIGCVTPNNVPSNNIIAVIKKTTLSDVTSNPGAYGVSITTNFIECGEVEINTTLSEIISGFVESTPNCDKIVFEIAGNHHLAGNEYEWSFPLYDNLATVINDGRKVEFNTQSVRQQTFTTTNPNEELSYSLTVSNPNFPSDVNVTGKEKIPECDFGGGSLLRIFPNPTSQNDVYLSFERIDLNNEDITIHVFDHQLRMVTSKQCTGMEPSLDVSDLGNGLYFICVMTNDGKMLNEKFCIDRR